jgi:nucleoside phosphorylase/NTP pyrophosphatase (non-canonical NTP hydrolase)
VGEVITTTTTKPEYTLDDLYLMVVSIYSDQNIQRPASTTFAHFVEVCGMLAIHDRKKKREELEVGDVLCKALGWFFPLLAKFRVRSVEELIFRKYPYACPYCRECPHTKACKETQGTRRSVDHDALRAKHAANISRRSRGLNQWQEMFDKIYEREPADLGTARSTLGLLEEIGELAEAIRVFEKHPKYFAGEAADVFSYLMGIANEHHLHLQIEGKPEFDFETEFLRRYPGMCLQCGYNVCICPTVPEVTVGRMAKELDLLPPEEDLFSLDLVKADEKGSTIGASILQALGGLASLADQLPLDRGETNRALMLLCLRLADEIRPRNIKLSGELHDAAVRIARDIMPPGTQKRRDSAAAVIDVLRSVWPLISLAVIPDDATLQTRLAKVLRAQACRIGIVAALPKEFAAMRSMLDEEVVQPVAGDPNHYVLGTIPLADGSGVHLVVVTLAKEMGNNSAGIAATHLMRSFAAVEDIFLVGIAGGIPAPESPEDHVRLGDIVVSDKEGIVQYDNLKLEVSAIKIRSVASKPSARLVGAVSFLESERVMKKYPWEAYIQRGKALEGCDRPPADTDRLYRWDGEDSREIKHPEDPSRRNDQPRVHYGRIGAANILLKNPQLRDQLRRDCGVKAIEMEGSGIADATWIAGQQYIVIRGVCDYCDPKKNQTWQGYAAIAAAAYARALIAAVPLSAYKA